MRVHGILKELEFNSGVFPRKALEEARARQKEITPELLRILVKATDNIELIWDEPAYFAHIYAMYLLAQFRERKGYQLIVDFFSIPGEITLDLTGDVVTEDLGRILAAVSGGDTSLIKRLIENQEANEYVRGAGLVSLMTLLAEGEIDRDEVVEYTKSLYQGGLEREPSHAWNLLVNCSADIHPEEVMDEIKQAYEDGLVDKGFIDYKWVEEHHACDRTQLLKRLAEVRHHRYIRDVVKEMEWWACFEQRKRGVSTKKGKVGRNEPCPCGSGRKYKRCCGSRL